jgi:hypothetical protein
MVRRVFVAAVALSMPALALVLFGGTVGALWSNPAAGASEFRVLDTTAGARPKAAPAPQAGEKTEVELSTWENTVSRFR